MQKIIAVGAADKQKHIMQDELITLETSILAKEKGFNEWCGTQYSKYIKDCKPYKSGDIERHNNSMRNSCCFSSDSHINYACPTQSLLQRWLFEIHNIYTTSLPHRNIEDGHIKLTFYSVLIKDLGQNIFCEADSLGASVEEFESPEQALEAGLQQALKLIDNGKQ